MGKKQLSDFLTQLSTDASLRARYEQDPGAAMAQAGLDPADRIALASGNADRLEAYLGEKPASVVRTAIVQETAIAPQAPIVQAPIVQEPAIAPAKKPIVQKPVVRKPVVRKPVVRSQWCASPR